MYSNVDPYYGGFHMMHRRCVSLQGAVRPAALLKRAVVPRRPVSVWTVYEMAKAAPRSELPSETVQIIMKIRVINRVQTE